jgi:PAS domain S-box-containing protein
LTAATPISDRDRPGEDSSPRPTVVTDYEPLLASILIVDDHPANLLALEGILEPLGQRIVKAGSGEEALKRLLDNEFAVILMDVQMPGLDGTQTARIIKEREKTRHVPIIFLTAISRDQANIFRGYSAGAVDYLLKPFDPDILRTKVQVFIDLWERGKRLERREIMIRQRERELLERASEIRFQNVTDSMPLCVLAGRPDGSIYWCNHVWQDYTGLSLEQTASGGWLEAVHPDDREALLAARKDLIGGGSDFALEHRIRRSRDSAYRWFLTRAVTEKNGRGDVVGWIGTMTDIDDQKRDREHLAEFKATLDATLDCVLMLQWSDLGVCYANHGAISQLGYELEELDQLQVTALQPQVTEERFREMIAPLRETDGGSLTYQTSYRRKDGDEFPVEVLLQYIQPGPGGGRFISVARDIRERVRAEQALRRANEAKDAFIAAASHELRTPLAAAKAQAQLALRRLKEEPDSPPAKSLRTITGQIDRMAKLVEDLLDVSRVQIGRLSLEIARYDLVPLVHEAAERVQALSEQHHIALHLPDKVELEGDRSRVDQVITNLLSNAIRYSPRGGEVSLTVEPEAGGVHLWVRDSGIGIPPEKQSLIFERFGRAHGSKYGGLGLGLTIAQGIVEQHGGEIWVESAGVAGEGSTFHVRLPQSALVRATQA